MNNDELVKGLTELLQKRIDAGWNRMGVRCETENMKYVERSKAVRSYIVDLFDGYEGVEGLHELEGLIDKSIAMYYFPKSAMDDFEEPEPDDFMEPEPKGY
ncbi:hypothetical protein [Selenomonas ruminantium]|uniref:Uncharacterized protein n=1 Tax=Selenomonas ruminantium TaxID=971 RepID=A0A1I0YBK6_SELRU|nr:hypothetical protein [Selenomonas ruminantium]SFB10651.1 hypothetical protein SAMN05216587_11186 [Selenomonas ruminantium]